jgi:hypothetical protein
MSERYFVRWVSELDPKTNMLCLKGWDVCDDSKFDRITVQSFGAGEKEQADGLCKLLNSIESES